MTSHWTCTSCLVVNGLEELQCAACGEFKGGQRSVKTSSISAISFGGAPAAPLPTMFNPPSGLITFGFDLTPANSMQAPSNGKENADAKTRPSPVFGYHQAAATEETVPAARLTFGRSVNGLQSVGGLPLNNNESSSTPQKGYRSPKTFCQTMETPVPKAGSPMLIDVDEELLVRDVPPSIMKMKTGCVWTWGSGECDQLAVRSDNLSELNQRKTPIIIKALSTPSCESIVAGSMHNLAVVDDGKALLSWGCNDEGALGRPIKNRGDHHNWKDAKAPCQNPDPTFAKSPGYVWSLPLETTITHVSAGGSHSALITATGDCYCWGTYRDQTGNIGFPDFERGSGSPSWYISESSERRLGQLVPTRVPHLRGVCIELVSGENHTAVLTASKNEPRTLYIWGASDFGQLGIEPLSAEDNNRTASLFPIEYTVENLQFSLPQTQLLQGEVCDLQPHPDIDRLRTGTLLHVYAGKYTIFFTIDVDGSPQTFGFGKNACGELGAGFVQPHVIHPVPLKSVKGLTWQDIRGGEFFTMGLACDGSVFTWGDAEWVGLGSEVAKSRKPVTEPRLISGLKQRIVAIEAAHRTAFALTKDGQLFGWGESSNYQIGDGREHEEPITRPMRIKPVLFDFGYVSAISGGAMHTLALVKPCPSETQKEEGMSVFSVEASPISRKRPRNWEESEEDAAQDHKNHKRARLKEHQINTDHLPCLSNPLITTGPPSTTLLVPPPTPTYSQGTMSDDLHDIALEQQPDDQVLTSLVSTMPEPVTAVQSTVDEDVDMDTPSQSESDISNDTPVKIHKFAADLSQDLPMQGTSSQSKGSATSHSHLSDKGDESSNEEVSEAEEATNSDDHVQKKDLSPQSTTGSTRQLRKMTKKNEEAVVSEEPSRAISGIEASRKSRAKKSLKVEATVTKELAPDEDEPIMKSKSIRERRGSKQLESVPESRGRLRNREAEPQGEEKTKNGGRRMTRSSKAEVNISSEEEMPKRQTRRSRKKEVEEAMSKKEEVKVPAKGRKGSKPQAKAKEPEKIEEKRQVKTQTTQTGHNNRKETEDMEQIEPRSRGRGRGRQAVPTQKKSLGTTSIEPSKSKSGTARKGNIESKRGRPQAEETKRQTRSRAAK